MARTSISVRVSDSVPSRLDALAPKLAPPGAEFGRSDAARAALERGLAVLEAEHGLVTADLPARVSAPQSTQATNGARRPTAAKHRTAAR
jgi:predicted transcriptional regulator